MSSTGDLMAGPAPGTAARLSGRAVARRLPVVVALGLAGGGLAVLATSNQPVEYSASTTVLVNPLDGNPFATGTRGQNLANLGTEAELISSDAVARLAQETMGTRETQAELVARLEVTNPPNSQVLQITFTDAQPQRAKAGADAFAKGYLTFRERRSADSVQAQIDNLTKAITSNESALKRSAAALAKTKSGTPERTLAQQKVTTATAEISRLESQVSDLRLFQGDPGQVLTPAVLPDAPTGLPPWAVQAGGAVLGLLLGLAIAIWRALSDQRLRSADDVKAAGLPALATVLPLRPGPERGGAVALLDDPGATLPDGVRLLRSMLALSMPMGGRLLVVPADHTSLRSASTLALAAALVRADRRVTVVDATGGRLTRHVLDDPVPGLSDALIGVARPEDVAVERQPGLRFMTAGTAAEATADKLASPAMREVVRTLAPSTEWLIIAGPVATSPEALSLAELCDCTVVAATLRCTTQTQLRKAVDAMTAGDANLVGIALDRAPVPRRLGPLNSVVETAEPQDSDEVDRTVVVGTIMPAVPAGDPDTDLEQAAAETSSSPSGAR
jgi:succinoglycan biosynthesis transport protein ExoP